MNLRTPVIVILIYLFTILVFISCEDNESKLNGNCYIKEIGDSDNYLMHLERTPYEIGYAKGYLRPDDVIRMCSRKLIRFR